jgi:hypothetical protein
VKRKIKIAIVLGIIVLLGIFASNIALNPLRRSAPSIRQWLEKTTPLGSTLAEVEATATKRGWYDSNLQGSDGKTKGTYLRGELGHYREIFTTSVTVFWEFDSSDRLVNIRIWKTMDAI